MDSTEADGASGGSDQQDGAARSVRRSRRGPVLVVIAAIVVAAAFGGLGYALGASYGAAQVAAAHAEVAAITKARDAAQEDTLATAGLLLRAQQQLRAAGG